MRAVFSRNMHRLAFLAALGLGCAAKQTPDSESSCRITTSIEISKPVEVRALPSAYWLSLLLRGYQSNGAIFRPSYTCEAQPVTWTADTCSVEPEPTVLDPRALKERDVTVENLGGKQRLVWAASDRLSDGQAQGPVALTEFDARGVAVRILGVLRGYAHRARLRLETVGDGTLLVAEGERCDDEEDANTCTRGVRIMVAGKERFIAKDLVDESGRCLGRAFFPLRAEGTLGRGANRKRYELQTSVTFGEEAVSVQEQLTIFPEGRAAQSADAAASSVSRMRADRQVQLRGGRLVSNGPSLLERWTRQQGSHD